MDFDYLRGELGSGLGTAAVIVMDQSTDVIKAIWRLSKFYKHESCGQCTPCRNGTAKALDLIRQPQWDTVLLGELSQVMRDASICGLGQAAPNPVNHLLTHFREELSR